MQKYSFCVNFQTYVYQDYSLDTALKAHATYPAYDHEQASGWEMQFAEYEFSNSAK
ncbi:hypothetical protein YYU_02350 [Anaplasma phagocytophilum str. HZ2]|nr:hypothetical protein YYU_02265 [Anaplasma phagocytophilum str. HZ2]AGR79340.1 hypothetical protein YYU_02350 [Anaplasma phagocytophilum str. HZ2]